MRGRTQCLQLCLPPSNATQSARPAPYACHVAGRYRSVRKIVSTRRWLRLRFHAPIAGGIGEPAAVESSVALSPLGERYCRSTRTHAQACGRAPVPYAQRSALVVHIFLPGCDEESRELWIPGRHGTQEVVCVSKELWWRLDRRAYIRVRAASEPDFGSRQAVADVFYPVSSSRAICLSAHAHAGTSRSKKHVLQQQQFVFGRVSVGRLGYLWCRYAPGAQKPSCRLSICYFSAVVKPGTLCVHVTGLIAPACLVCCFPIGADGV